MVGVLETLLTIALLAQAAAPIPQSKPTETPSAVATATASKQAEADSAKDLDPERRLLKVKRVYIESFGDDPISKEIQAMVISSLTESKKVIVTENKDRADAVLKGSGLEKTSQEIHAYSDSTAAGGAAGGHSGSVSGNWIHGTGSVSGSSSGGFVSRSAAISDSSLNTETIDHARVAVRLVDQNGDVIWTTTQESKGGKYKGASADVAEMVVKQLVRDIEKAAKQQSSTSAVSQ